MTKSRFEVRREQFSLQAHFASPEFDLFKDVPELARHLFNNLSGYGIRLADLKFDSSGGSLGDVNLRVLSLSDHDTVRLFLDRLEVSLDNPSFLSWKEGNLIPDFLISVAEYSPAISFKAFAVTQAIHGIPESSPKDFLARFSSAAPKKLGSFLGSGAVFYYGASEGILAGTIILDLSHLVEGGVFLKLSAIYDASLVEPSDVLAVARGDLADVLGEVGLERGGA